MENECIFEIDIRKQLYLDSIDKQLFFIWEKLRKYNKYTTDCEIYFLEDESKKKVILQDWYDWYLINAIGTRELGDYGDNLKVLQMLHHSYTKEYGISIFENKHNLLTCNIVNTVGLCKLRFTFIYDNEMNPQKNINCYTKIIINSLNYLYRGLKGIIVDSFKISKEVEYGSIEVNNPLFNIF
jgi:hypothetical protein